MNHQMLSKVQEQIKKYQAENRGESPLYIILSSDEADDLSEQVRNEKGYDENVIVTEFEGTKIVKYAAMNPGDMRLTNELPETSS